MKKRGTRLRTTRAYAVLLVVLCACDEATAPAVPVDVDEPVALDLMGTDFTYRGFPGGLVDTGTPTVTPIDDRIVVVAISMSNGRLEFDRFIELYGAHPNVHPRIDWSTVPEAATRSSDGSP